MYNIYVSVWVYMYTEGRVRTGKSTHARTKISIILFYEFTRSNEC